MVVIPFILVYPTTYQWCLQDEKAVALTDTCPEDQQQMNTGLYDVELAVDILFIIEILFNFVKVTKAHSTLSSIASNYLTGYFIFDVLSIIPIFAGEDHDYLFYKGFRILHGARLAMPLKILLETALSSYSKKR